MPFRIVATTMDVQTALTNQGYTVARSGNLDRLDTNIASRAAPGAAMGLVAPFDARLDAAVSSRADGAAYTAARAGNLDAAISSRAAPGAAMAIVDAARAAIWNELIPVTPVAGSFGARVNSSLDVAVSSRADGGAYTAARAGNLDRLDALISSRAAPGAAMGLATPFDARLDAAVSSRADGAAYTAARAGHLDAAISSRAAPGAAMEIVPAARAAIWNEATGTPAAGSFGARINSNLDAAVSSRADGAAYTAARAGNLDAAISSRAAPGAAMAIVDAARAAIWNELIPVTPVAGSFGARVNSSLDVAVSSRADGGAYTAARAGNLDRLDTNIASRATPADVDTQLGGRGVTTARMARMDMVAAQATNSGSVTAAGNTAGLTVSLDTGGAVGQARAVIEIRYTCGAGATFFAEGSDDNVTWFVGDTFSDAAAVTNRLVGYLNAHRFFRFRSPTTGIVLSFHIHAIL